MNIFEKKTFVSLWLTLEHVHLKVRHFQLLLLDLFDGWHTTFRCITPPHITYRVSSWFKFSYFLFRVILSAVWPNLSLETRPVVSSDLFLYPFFTHSSATLFPLTSTWDSTQQRLFIPIIWILNFAWWIWICYTVRPFVFMSSGQDSGVHQKAHFH